MMQRDDFRERAQQLDAADELAPFRARFHRPADRIYLVGNSLGLLSRDAERSLARVAAEWRTAGIGGWSEGDAPWLTLPEKLAARLAKFVGAESDEVAIANSTTVNLHQLLATLFNPRRAKNKLLIDALSFPSDRYALRSHLALRGLDPHAHLVIARAEPNGLLEERAIARQFETEGVQLAVLPSVVYTTGQLLDLDFLARAARENGVLIGFDLSHSIGVMPHALDRAGADFAFWCHYKYVNGGPGAVAGMYLNRRHFSADGAVTAGLAGWWSARQERMFEMADELIPAHGASGLQIGTPLILGLAPLEGAFTLLEEAGLDRIRAKSLRLTDYLRELIEAMPREFGFTIATPREDARRGGHLALLHDEAAAIGRALKAAGVVPDFRPPNMIRLAPAPLYTSFDDCFRAVEILHEIMRSDAQKNWATERELVP